MKKAEIITLVVSLLVIALGLVFFVVLTRKGQEEAEKKERLENLEAEEARRQGQILAGLELVIPEYIERENHGHPIKCPDPLCSGWGLKLERESMDDPVVCFYVADSLSADRFVLRDGKYVKEALGDLVEVKVPRVGDLREGVVGVFVSHIARLPEYYATLAMSLLDLGILKTGETPADGMADLRWALLNMGAKESRFGWLVESVHPEGFIANKIGDIKSRSLEDLGGSLSGPDLWDRKYDGTLFYCGRSFNLRQSVDAYPKHMKLAEERYEKSRLRRMEQKEAKRREAQKSPELKELEKVNRELRELREEVRKRGP